MVVIARILCTALLVSVVAGVCVYGVLRPSPDAFGIALCLGVVTGVIGAIAGAGREVVAALGRRSDSNAGRHDDA